MPKEPGIDLLQDCATSILGSNVFENNTLQSAA